MRSTARSAAGLLTLAALVPALALAPACAASSTTPAITGTGAAGTTASGTGGTTASSSGAGASSGTSTSSSTTSAGSTSSGGTGTFACAVKSAVSYSCTEYQNLNAAELAAQEASCAMVVGTTPATCSSADSLGTCTVTVAGVTAVTTWYSGTATTALEAQTSCQGGGGTWTPG